MIAPGPRLGSRFRLRSPSELGFRARQRLQIWLELFAGGARGQEPGDEMLARVVVAGHSWPFGEEGHRRGEQADAPFEALARGDRVGSLVARRFPEAAARILARADRAVADRFDIFGFEGLSYGEPIDWHRDPLRDRRAPLVHWSRVPYLDAGQVGDHKVIWELNRHQHLVTLGQAYCLTGDERYASTIVRHLTAWMDANPPKLGINWSSSLELAFRAISWTWALHLVRSSPSLVPAFVTRVLKFLYLHARHINAHLSTYFSPNTHLTGEALGLLYLGTCFGQFRDAERWREAGWSILEAELDRQVRPDGTYFEQTTWYHRYTADFYLHAIQLREYAGVAVPENVRHRVSQLIDVLVHFTDPRGLTPLIGDDDGGQLLPLLIAEPNDFRATLAHAAVALVRSDCAALAADGAPCLPWLVGSSGLARFESIEPRLPREPTRLFGDGGYFIARDRWAATADFIVVDCGPHGALSCGHAHADALAVELSLGGVPILVDPGTYSYVQPERDAFRTTLAHNTITVDGFPSSQPDRPFRWKTAANCNILRTAADGTFAYFEGEHDGFMRLADPVRHRRAVFAIFGELVVLLDTIEAGSTHTVAGRLHFDPALKVLAHPERAAFSVFLREAPDQPLADCFILGEGVTVSCEAGRVAPTYAILHEADVGSFTSVGTGTRSLWTVVIPRDASAANARASITTLDAGRLLTIKMDDTEQFVVARASGSSFDGLVTDADWTWIRRPVGQARPDEFVMIDAASLSIGGDAVVSLPSRRQHVRGRFVDGSWQLDVSLT